MSRRLFTSDTHFNHAVTVKSRGFSSKEEHDEVILDNILTACRKQDTLYVLGDIAGANDRVALELFARIAAKIETLVLVSGNHDRTHPKNPNGAAAQRKYLEVFSSVVSTQTIRLGDDRVLLNHHPYDRAGGDHTPVNRDRQWRPVDLGSWLIHGHTHLTDQRVHDGRQIHVGVDAWDFKPVHESTLVDLIRLHPGGGPVTAQVTA